MIAYVFGTVGIFRLVRDGLASPAISAAQSPMIRVTAWLAALVYAANPNLIYLQATAMGEPLYLSLFIWAVVYFSEFVKHSAKVEDKPAERSSSLVKCGACLAAACLTRYDAWFLAGVMCIAAVAVVLRTRSHAQNLKIQFWKVSCPCGCSAGALARIQHDRLSQSAGVRQRPLLCQGNRTAKPATSHPGSHDLQTAFSYFLKSAELNMSSERGQKIWILLALAGAIASLFRWRSIVADCCCSWNSFAVLRTLRRL